MLWLPNRKLVPAAALNRGVSDPFFTSVVFLSGFQGVNGQTGNITEDSSAHRTFAIGSSQSLSNTQVLYGTTSLLQFNTNVAGGVVDTPDWILAPTTTSPYTLEYFFWSPDVANNVFPIGQSGSWATQHNGADFIMNGPPSAAVSASGAFTGLAQQWVHACVENNSAGKTRLYVNGVMKGSASPANGAFADSANTLTFVLAGPGQTAYFGETRITKGVARYNNDSGFTVPSVPFPRY